VQGCVARPPGWLGVICLVGADANKGFSDKARNILNRLFDKMMQKTKHSLLEFVKDSNEADMDYYECN
jgi:hypothetical protein